MTPAQAPSAERLAGLVQLTLVFTRWHRPSYVSATRYDTKNVGYEVHRVFYEPDSQRFFYQAVWIGDTPSTPVHEVDARDTVRACPSELILAHLVALQFVDSRALQLADAAVAQHQANGDTDMAALLRGVVAHIDQAALNGGRWGSLVKYEEWFAPGDWDATGAPWVEPLRVEELTL